MPEDFLDIRGARVHNLKNITVRLPHNQLVVITGVSGSGKSTLAFDIIFAEGQRRYVESLSSYARQFLERLEKPDVDEVLGIPPTVAIRQKNSTTDPRSTVATATEIHDYLRLLFARAGRTLCTNCGARVRDDSVRAVVDQVLGWPEGSRWYVLFPMESAHGDGHNGSSKRRDALLKATLTRLRDGGYSRLFQDDTVFEFSTPESLLDIDFSRRVFVLADRIAVRPGVRERLADTVEIAYRESREVLFKRFGEPGDLRRFSARFECSKCGQAHERPEPDMFSLSSERARCPACLGKGGRLECDPARLLHPATTAAEFYDALWTVGGHDALSVDFLQGCILRKLDITAPVSLLSPSDRRWIEEGDGVFRGLRHYFERMEPRPCSGNSKRLRRWQYWKTCKECGGRRFGATVRNVIVGGHSLDQILTWTLAQARTFFDRLDLEGAEATVASPLLPQILNRLNYLEDVGLGYLTLDRRVRTLSGGETQRIQLATSLGSRLVGVCYVLDEPTVGLHCRDTRRLIGILERLRDLGNSVVVVEHDPEMMCASDHLVDLGPDAGEGGGQVSFSGTYEAIQASDDSLTGQFLSGRATIPIPARRRKPDPERVLGFRGANRHNLQNLSFEIPLGLVTAVTGVSGSGKSTLVRDVILERVKTLQESVGAHSQDWPDGLQELGVRGGNLLQGVVWVDQSAGNLTSRSVPATYLGVFDKIREVFAITAAGGKMGSGWFSFNSQFGACPTCKGTGTVMVDMHFLADVPTVCEGCDGKRYQSRILEVSYEGKNIWDVLQMTVDEAVRFFHDHAGIVGPLTVLSKIGLGYLRLGQPSRQLSGGEAQRLRLAQRIAAGKTHNTLFLFDEPTTGLHFADIRKLLDAFETLMANGSTVVVIEHNLDLIKSADWVIDLGPEGGSGGGSIVVEGPPEVIASHPDSRTGHYLKEVLG